MVRYAFKDFTAEFMTPARIFCDLSDSRLVTRDDELGCIRTPGVGLAVSQQPLNPEVAAYVDALDLPDIVSRHRGMVYGGYPDDCRSYTLDNPTSILSLQQQLWSIFPPDPGRAAFFADIAARSRAVSVATGYAVSSGDLRVELSPPPCGIHLDGGELRGGTAYRGPSTAFAPLAVLADRASLVNPDFDTAAYRERIARNLATHDQKLFNREVSFPSANSKGLQGWSRYPARGSLFIFKAGRPHSSPTPDRFEPRLLLLLNTNEPSTPFY
jgi:hypothetical protein